MKITNFKPVFVLLVMIFCMVNIKATNNSERVIDGVIETVDNRSSYYKYNTVTSKKSCDSLKITSSKLDPSQKNIDINKLLRVFQGNISSHFYSHQNVMNNLEGKRIIVHVYINSNGQTLLEGIYSKVNLIDMVGSKALTDIIEIILSYKFNIEDVGENCYYDAAISLKVAQ
jgi:hypothetical protein